MAAVIPRPLAPVAQRPAKISNMRSGSRALMGLAEGSIIGLGWLFAARLARQSPGPGRSSPCYRLSHRHRDRTRLRGSLAACSLVLRRRGPVPPIRLREPCRGVVRVVRLHPGSRIRPDRGAGSTRVHVDGRVGERLLQPRTAPSQERVRRRDRADGRLHDHQPRRDPLGHRSEQDLPRS